MALRLDFRDQASSGHQFSLETGLCLALGEQQYDQHDADHGNEVECLLLTVPRLRLPHGEPLAADGDETHRVEQQAERQAGDSQGLGLAECW